MKKIFLVFTMIGIFFSCNKNEPNLHKVDSNNKIDPNNSPQSEFICSGHRINRYYKMNEISIKEDAIKQDKDGNFLMTLDFVSDEFFGYRKPEQSVSLFNECAKKFGDLSSKMMFPEPIDAGFAISAYIKSISLTSSDAFDADHPAGASLADIVRLEYLTPYPCIKNAYSIEGFKNLISPTVHPSDIAYGIQQIDKLISQLTKDELAMVYITTNVVGNGLTYKNQAPLYRIKFTKAPTKEVQKITIKIETDEGKYSITKKVAFL